MIDELRMDENDYISQIQDLTRKLNEVIQLLNSKHGDKYIIDKLRAEEDKSLKEKYLIRLTREKKDISHRVGATTLISPEELAIIARDHAVEVCDHAIKNYSEVHEEMSCASYIRKALLNMK